MCIWFARKKSLMSMVRTALLVLVLTVVAQMMSPPALAQSPQQKSSQQAQSAPTGSGVRVEALQNSV